MGLEKSRPSDIRRTPHVREIDNSGSGLYTARSIPSQQISYTGCRRNSSAVSKNGSRINLVMNSHQNRCGSAESFFNQLKIPALWLLTALKGISGRPDGARAFRIPIFTKRAFAASLIVAASQVQAGNILLNTNFAANTGQAVATGWTYFKPPTVASTTHDYWIGGPPTSGFFAAPYTGTQYWKEWGAGYFASPVNNVAGLQQTFGSS